MGASCSGNGCTATEQAITPAAAAAIGRDAAVINNTGFALWGAAAGLILAGIGAYKQYQMYAKMGDLAEAQQKLIDSQRERYEKLMDSIFLPNMKQARENLWSYAIPFAKSVSETVIECATRACAYTRRKTNSTVAAANVARVMSGARRTLRRSMNPRASGVCCDNDARLSALQAQLVVGQMASADRYEDAQEFQWNQFYWNKMLGGAQLAQRMGELGANLAQGASSQLSNVMAGASASISQGQNNLQASGAALQGQGAVFGGVGALGGLTAGNLLGNQQGKGIIESIFGNSPVGAGTGNTAGVNSIFDNNLALPVPGADGLAGP